MFCSTFLNLFPNWISHLNMNENFPHILVISIFKGEKLFFFSNYVIQQQSFNKGKQFTITEPHKKKNWNHLQQPQCFVNSHLPSFVEMKNMRGFFISWFCDIFHNYCRDGKWKMHYKHLMTIIIMWWQIKWNFILTDVQVLSFNHFMALKWCRIRITKWSNYPLLNDFTHKTL